MNEERAESLLQYGPLVWARIGPPPRSYMLGPIDISSQHPHLLDPSLPPPQPFRAQLMIDTGSTITVIYQSYLRRLGTPMIAERPIFGIEQESRFYKMYMATLGIQAEPNGNYLTVTTEVAEIQDPPEPMPHAGYLGRDLLRYFLFTYNGLSGEIALNKL